MRREEKTIYELGPSFRTQGGISSVLYTYHLHFASGMDMRFIPTYSGNSRLMDLILFTAALFRVFFICLTRRGSLFQIHSSTYGSYLRKSMLARICMAFDQKVIIHIHGADFDSFIREASDRHKKRITDLLKKADRVVVLSESWREFFSGYVPKEKIRVIYNPIREIREEYLHKSNSPVRVLFMGRLGERKGTYDLIEAVRQIRDRCFILELYGDGDNKRIEDIVGKYNLRHMIRVNGWAAHNSVAGIYDRSDILVLPSYAEGLPMSVIEGMGRGLPIIASNAGGITEAVQDGCNGFIVKPGDRDAIARKIVALTEDAALRTAMGQNSLKIAKEKFSVDKVGIELEKMFTELQRGEI